MTIRRLRLIAAPLAALLLAAATPAPQPGAAAERVRADVEFLAGDLLEGRDTGSRGYEIAAAYVASRFRAIGLEPGGDAGSWYQRVPLRRSSHAAPPSASLLIGRDSVNLNNEVDFALRPSLTQQARAVDAPLVFVGRGISDARLGIDDYAGVDVRGKIAVALQGTPSGLDSEVAAHLDLTKDGVAASKGALGLIEITGAGPRPGLQGLSSYARPVVDWIAPAAGGGSAKLSVTGAISRQVAERLFASAGRNLQRALADRGRPGGLKAFDFPVRLKIDDRMQWEDFTSPNVVGILPGSDPALGEEYVVLMAHLDHLGTTEDAEPGEDRIYNGAIDNAAGIATMLQTARAFAASGKAPRRSVLFIAVTGEERGLRGADYFGAYPPVPWGKIVGAVNFDMPLLLYEFTDVVAFGGEHSTIARTIADAAGAMGVAVSPDPMPEQAIFVRSDHYRFVTRGVPSILLMTGYANGGEAKWSQFFSTIYHKLNDDLSLPILWEQGARYAELNYRIARALADADERPRWYAGDYFGETFAPARPKAEKRQLDLKPLSP